MNIDLDIDEFENEINEAYDLSKYQGFDYDLCKSKFDELPMKSQVQIMVLYLQLGGVISEKKLAKRKNELKVFIKKLNICSTLTEAGTSGLTLSRAAIVAPIILYKVRENFVRNGRLLRIYNSSLSVEMNDPAFCSILNRINDPRWEPLLKAHCDLIKSDLNKATNFVKVGISHDEQVNEFFRNRVKDQLRVMSSLNYPTFAVNENSKAQGSKVNIESSEDGEQSADQSKLGESKTENELPIKSDDANKVDNPLPKMSYLDASKRKAPGDKIRDKIDLMTSSNSKKVTNYLNEVDKNPARWKGYIEGERVNTESKNMEAIYLLVPKTENGVSAFTGGNITDLKNLNRKYHIDYLYWYFEQVNE